MTALIPIQRRGYSVGVCATGDDVDFESLAATILADSEEIDLTLREVIVVASACPPSTVARLEGIARHDPRVHLIIEKERHGKADAINKILENSSGEFLVMVNSDARPEKGAFAKLLREMNDDEKIGAISAHPLPDTRSGASSLLMEFMWTAHNDCSLTLNHMDISNHSSDELVAFRSSSISQLPLGLVNDGAFLAATARSRGYSVRFCMPARVHIATPTIVADAIRQRRRILFGHLQVWQKTGSPPKTIESLMVLRPLVGLKILIGTIARNPRFLLILPVAVLSELSAALLSICDAIGSSERHAIWRRYK
jgi:cellulose synthase/poly-beta-1,6-N-acetylglucosamine synthase-like glycosyltransferase